MTTAQFQIGKNGLTEGTIEALENALKNHSQVRIAVLKAAGHNKETIKELIEQLKTKLGNHHVYKSLGFKIIILRRKPTQKL